MLDWTTIKIELTIDDVLPDAVLTRYLAYRFEVFSAVFKKHYNSKVMSEMAYTHRPFLDFIPRRQR